MKVIVQGSFPLILAVLCLAFVRTAEEGQESIPREGSASPVQAFLHAEDLVVGDWPFFLVYELRNISLGVVVVPEADTLRSFLKMGLSQPKGPGELGVRRALSHRAGDQPPRTVELAPGEAVFVLLQMHPDGFLRKELLEGEFSFSVEGDPPSQWIADCKALFPGVDQVVVGGAPPVSLSLFLSKSMSLIESAKAPAALVTKLRAAMEVKIGLARRFASLDAELDAARSNGKEAVVKELEARLERLSQEDLIFDPNLWAQFDLEGVVFADDYYMQCVSSCVDLILPDMYRNYLAAVQIHRPSSSGALLAQELTRLDRLGVSPREALSARVSVR